MPVLLLLEHDITFNPLEEGLTKDIPSSTVVRWRSRTVKGLDSILKVRPVLAKSYLVLLSMEPKPDILKLIQDYDKHTYVFKTNRPSVLDEYKLLLSDHGIGFTVIDNYNKTKEECLAYIMEMLNVSEKIAKSIYSRCNKYIPRIVESVEFLKLLEVVTVKEVSLYVPRYKQASFDDLFLHLVAVKGLSNSAIYELLRYYERGHRFIAKYLFKKCRLWLNIFEDMESLTLLYSNLDEYYEENKKSLAMTRKQLQFVMSMFGEVSVDFLYLLCVRLSRLCDDFREAEFITLLGGN